MNCVLCRNEKREGCNLWNDGWLRRCPICFTSVKFTASLSSTYGLPTISILSAQFLPSLPLPCSETSLGASVLLYFSRDVFKYTTVIVGLPIIPFLPVHLSLVTLQVEDLHFVVKAERSADAEHVRSYQDESRLFESKCSIGESNGTSVLEQDTWILTSVHKQNLK